MRRTGLAVAVLLAASFVACAPAPDTPSPPPASSAPMDRAGAPPIDEPRDLRPRVADPCGTLLTNAQVRRLGYDSVGEFQPTEIGGRSCIWRDSGTLRRLQVTVAILEGRDLFVGAYRNRFLPIFRPHEISGLPAVDVKQSERATFCITTIGVADFQTLDIAGSVGQRTFGERETEPCTLTRRAAEAIVSTLPPL